MQTLYQWRYNTLTPNISLTTYTTNMVCAIQNTRIESGFSCEQAQRTQDEFRSSLGNITAQGRCCNIQHVKINFSENIQP